jgi:hypothetical protein
MSCAKARPAAPSVALKVAAHFVVTAQQRANSGFARQGQSERPGMVESES